MRISNKRANYDYELKEHFEAGVKLYGAEVKAVRLGHADLTGSHVRIIGNEAFLIGAAVFPYQYSRPESYDERRTRKLLMHGSEILALKHKMDGANLTLVPISLYTKHGFIKLEISLGKGKKQYEKKESKKKKDIQRELEQGL